MCCIYLNPRQYLTDSKTLEDRIHRIEQLIDAMILSTLNVVSDNDYNPNVSEYQLNDGQMTVRTSYKTNNDVFASIQQLEKTKQIYVNQLNGRVFTSRDIRSLRRY